MKQIVTQLEISLKDAKIEITNNNYSVLELKNRINRLTLLLDHSGIKYNQWMKYVHPADKNYVLKESKKIKIENKFTASKSIKSESNKNTLGSEIKPLIPKHSNIYFDNSDVSYLKTGNLKEDGNLGSKNKLKLENEFKKERIEKLEQDFKIIYETLTAKIKSLEL